ncbi:MAG: pirin family protein, partial [Bacteroidota bacterium]|nr:pirin family protein [Bacteroidota bacterium]
KGPIEPLTDIHLCWIEFNEDGHTNFTVPPSQTIFFYVVKGEVNANGTVAPIHHLVQFENDGDAIEIIANTNAMILFGFAAPFNEPFAAYGPFVMNSKEEIMQAFDDYNKGKFGSEEELMN